MGKSLIKKEIQLDGLSCTACENLIKREVEKLEGVSEIQVDYKTSRVVISFEEDKISLKEIQSRIEKLGYQWKGEVPESKKRKENETFTYPVFIITGVILFGLYMIINHTVGFNFIPEVSQNMGYGILFVVGLMTSLHCVAMCGGINLSVCMSYKNKAGSNSSSTYEKLVPSLMYNGGRVISYTVLGGIIGAVGSVFSISNTGKSFITIVAGVFMIIMGLNMLNIFPWLRKINPRMPKFLATRIQSGKHNKGPFIVGLLNGLMPCGPLQAMQIYALGTGSFIAGALSMMIFSLGTVPLMFLFGTLGTMLSGKFTKNMLKISAVLVMVLGVIMLSRGMAFTGSTGMDLSSITKSGEDSASATTASQNNSGGSSDTTATINGDVQEVTMNITSSSYEPITVVKGVPVKWTIIATEDTLTGCNGEIIVPEYNIDQKLQVGENVINFTPTETGSFGYSCWMGMIRSSITVTEGDATDTTTETTTDSTTTENASTTTTGTDTSTDTSTTGQEVDNTGIPQGCCGN